MEVVADHSNGARGDRAGPYNIRPPERRERRSNNIGLAVYHRQSFRMEPQATSISSNLNPLTILNFNG